MAVTPGAAQVSVLGPDLWNASYDSLLRMEMPEESCLVRYADDVAALVAACTIDQLIQIKLNGAIRLVNNWSIARADVSSQRDRSSGLN